MDAREVACLQERVTKLNERKGLFTPGPASLSIHNLAGLGPCFGRGDDEYEKVHSRVMASLAKISGQRKVVAMQGAASLALEILSLNFLFGKVVVVNTGYYSDRLRLLAELNREGLGSVTQIDSVDWIDIGDLHGKVDWVLACSTDTSVGLAVPISDLRAMADSLGARLALDATGSIGLEKDHDLADVMAFSSCKGLFGLTGAGFVAYSVEPSIEVESFYLDIQSHIDRKMTGPYSTIQSLSLAITRHEELLSSVVLNKNIFIDRWHSSLVWPMRNQPNLCTKTALKLISRSGNSVMYTPRGNHSGTVVSHLGEVHLGKQARGDLLNDLMEGD